METHDGSDDEQTFAVVTEWTMPPAWDGALHHTVPSDSGPSEPGPDDPGLSDAALIQRSRREPGCFAGIYDRHAAEILRYVHARLGPDLAEDITAETFLAAFRRRDSYDPDRADARPWLYGIAVRLIGRHRRAESRYRRMVQAAPAERLAADFGDRSAERVTAEQLRPRIAAVLNGLPARDRELLLLIAWAGLSYEESAQALGISTSAVRSRLNRIRVRARKELGGANPARRARRTTMDEIALFFELAPAPPVAAEEAALRDRARARVAGTLEKSGPRTGTGRGAGRWFPRQWRIVLGAAALSAAAAVVVVPTVLPGGGPAAVTTRAWAVEPAGHGTVRVTVRELLDPAGLERALRAQGAPAYVQFLPGPVRRKGNIFVSPLCFTRGEPWLHVSPSESHQVFSIPSAAETNRISFLIHPAAIPAGTAVLIWIQGTPPLMQDKNGWSDYAAAFTLVRTGHLPHCVGI